jgi:amidase
MNPVDEAIARIEATRALNGVIVDNPKRSRAEAKRGTGRLAGTPFSVKDNIAVEGWPLSLGVHVDPPPATFTATVVARLRAAGAVLVAKTNLPPYGGGIETVNDVFGRTNNPYDLSRTVGGSSGGEAAAVAAGISRFGLGTDSGASVRLPAHFCGLAALKPTAGRVPVLGVNDDLGQIGPMSDPRTQIGILARTVADVALVLDVIGDPLALRGAPARSVRGLRVALFIDDGDAGTVAAVHAAAGALHAAGALVAEAAPPAGGHEITKEVWRSYGDDAISYELLRRWDAYRDELAAFGTRYDVILSPVFGVPAPPHGVLASEPDRTHYTNPHNLTGRPAATVRAGTSPDGLPIGVQLAARPWEDETALAAEAASGGYAAP